MINSIADNWLLGAFFCRFNTFVQGNKKKEIVKLIKIIN